MVFHQGTCKIFSSELDNAREEVLADAQLCGQTTATCLRKRIHLTLVFTSFLSDCWPSIASLEHKSEVGQIQVTADRLAAEVDRVVVLGIGGSFMGARALLEACCHPYYNELPRAGRGNRPRITFEGNNVDNDAMQGLFDVLAGETDCGWAINVISKSGGTLETAAAFRILLKKLNEACVSNNTNLASRVVPITGKSGKLFDLATSLGCEEIFAVPDGVGGRFSVLSAVGLMPAAIMGLNIVKLLEGAAAMNEHFRSAPVGENAVLDYTGICHLLEEKQGCDVRLLSTWGKRLEAVGLWYDQLLSESLGKQERGAMPLTVVNTRDLHSRGQQHQEGKRDKLVTNVTIGSCEREAVSVGSSELNQEPTQ